MPAVWAGQGAVEVRSVGLRAPGTRWLNRLFERALALTVDHQVGVDTLEATRDVFDDVTVVDRDDAGSGYVLVAEKPADA